MTQHALAAAHDVLLLDLDGVVYKGPHPVPHAVTSLCAVHEQFGVRLAYVTNNASRTPAEVASTLRGFGLPAEPEDVVTSAQAGARVLAEHIAPGDNVLVVGGPGLVAAVRERGFSVVDAAADQPVAVIQGFHPQVGWAQMAEATYAVRAGALFVATNTDRTIPTAFGIAPGNGLLVGVVTAASGVEPVVAGKPETPLMAESIARTAAVRPLVVGDRLDTDIEGANRAGIPSLLVLTGVSTRAEAQTADRSVRPTYIADDLRALLELPVLFDSSDVDSRDVGGAD